MRSASTTVALAGLVALLTVTHAAAQGDVWLRGPDTAFRISRAHGNLVSGQRNGQAIIARCHDAYWWITDTGKTVLDESADVVTQCKADATGVWLTCRVPGVDLEVHKEYRLAAGGRALAKRVTVPVLGKRGVLRVRSVVALDEGFRQRASYYCQASVVGAPRPNARSSACARPRTSPLPSPRARAGTRGWSWPSTPLGP